MRNDSLSIQEPSANKQENLSNIFKLLEESKNLLDIESYFISHLTLDQIFMSFTSKTTCNSNNPATCYEVKDHNKINFSSEQVDCNEQPIVEIEDIRF
jgi:ferredoxin-like protein FixX